jgi:hypothetical protein
LHHPCKCLPPPAVVFCVDVSWLLLQVIGCFTLERSHGSSRGFSSKEVDTIVEFAFAGKCWASLFQFEVVASRFHSIQRLLQPLPPSLAWPLSLPLLTSWSPLLQTGKPQFSSSRSKWIYFETVHLGIYALTHHLQVDHELSLHSSQLLAIPNGCNHTVVSFSWCICFQGSNKFRAEH